MASTPDPFLASSWSLNNSGNLREYQEFCRAFALELQTQPQNTIEEDDLNYKTDKFITLLHGAPSSPFSFWSMACMVIGDVLNIRLDKLSQLDGPQNNQYCRRLNHGIQDLFPVTPKQGPRLNAATSNSLIHETLDPDF